jgi:cytochrome c oxidase subunit I+III
LQCQRLPGPSFIPLTAALTLGGFFVFGTFGLWILALASVVVSTSVIVYWLWTSTARPPEKPAKDVGLGLSLPTYLAGSESVGWWGMLITMLADITAYVCIVFGYFFFWTIHEDFPPRAQPGPGTFWPMLSALLLVSAWAATLLARRCNQRNQGRLFALLLIAAFSCAVAGGFALLAGPWLGGLDPTQHAYPATVWLLVLWTVVHVLSGLIMHVYCLARRLRGYMTDEYDMDMHNVCLYWHFTVLTVLITVAVIAGFPLVA